MTAVTFQAKPGFRPPHRASVIGLWLTLAALGMLFVSSMLLYVLMHLHIFGRTETTPIEIPPFAWGSTLVLLTGSLTIHRAVANIRLERLQLSLKYLYLTGALAVLFLIVQTPCMVEILQAHQYYEALSRATAQPGRIAPVSLYGLVFTLILLHALHVLGGIVALAVVTWRTQHHQYDHENYLGIQFTARYWHFLDVVWIAMFTMFLVLG